LSKVLVSLYDCLVCVVVHVVKCDNVATFLGRKLGGHYKDEVGDDFHTCIMGTCVKHYVGFVVIKMYDKGGVGVAC